MIVIPRRFKRVRRPLPTLNRPKRPRRRGPEPVTYERLIDVLAPIWRSLSRVERRLDALAFASRDRADRCDDGTNMGGLRITRKPGA